MEKKLSMDFGLDFPFPMGNAVREGQRGSNQQGFSDGSSEADRRTELFFTPLPHWTIGEPDPCILWAVTENQVYSSAELVQAYRASSTSCSGWPKARQGWLPVPQAANRRACWLLSNSLLGKWARVSTGEDLHRWITQKSFLVILFILISQWIWEIDRKLWKSESLLDVLLGVVPSVVFVYSVLNQCSHYYKDRHSKKNLASLPQEQIMPFKYISFFMQLISEIPVILQHNSKEKFTSCAEEKISYL